MLQSNAPLMDFFSNIFYPISNAIAQNLDFSRRKKETENSFNDNQKHNYNNNNIEDQVKHVYQNQVQHPKDKQELKEIIQEARRSHKVIRIKGSGHSFPVESCLPRAASREPIVIALDHEYWRQIIDITEVSSESARVTVRSGIHIGTNHALPKRDYPVEIRDIRGNKTVVTNQQLGTLSILLWKQGWVLPDLGGVDHQTLGGFISTGSAGGSAMAKHHDFADCLLSMTLIDGSGEEHVLSRSDDPDDPFFAVSVVSNNHHKNQNCKNLVGSENEQFQLPIIKCV